MHPPPPPLFIPPSKKKVSNNNSNDNNNTTCVDSDIKMAIVFVFGIIFLLLLVGGFVYAIIYGDTDEFNLEFLINSVEVTSMKVVYNVGDKKQHLMADLDFNLTLKKRIPGHASFYEQIYFNPMIVSLEGYHHDEFLSSTRLEPYLLLQNQYQHQLQFGMQIENKTVDSMSSSQDSSVVQFVLKGEGGCLSSFGDPFKNCSIDLLCDDIKVRILPANNFTTRSMSMVVSPLPLSCKCKLDCHRIDAKY